MADELAIQGNYADFKLVKTRNVAQLVIEIPIERAKQAIDAFGIPQPSAEIPVAVARLNVTTQKDSAVAAPEPRTEPKEHKPPRDWDDLRPSQQAGIRCGDPVFQTWAWETDGRPTMVRPGPDHATAFVRFQCGVHSRKELDSNPAKAAAWDELEAKFIEDTRLPERH